MLLALLALAGASRAAATPLDDTVDADLEYARDQLTAAAASVPVDRYPSLTGADGTWETTGPAEWTSGFFPGSLWLGFEATGDPFLRAQAEARLASLQGERLDRTGNDQGFKLLTSFGNAYRLTGVDRYRRIAVRGARSLASRFDPVAGATRSWGRRGSPTFTVIVDNLMNLELLFWGARNGGDPAWHAIALSHALRTARTHVRPDGSTFHVVELDPRTGSVKRKRTQQGYARGSTWARGQAWAIHGFAMAYRETGAARLLAAARRTAGWYLDHLPPDQIPYWDFDAPGIPAAPRDSSAAAIAAAGLFELAELDPDPASGARWRAAAERTIASLSTPAYLARDTSSDSILLHGTQDLPRGSSDTGISFGDYYFLEALLRDRTPPQAEPGARLQIHPGRRTLRARVVSGVPGRVRAAVVAKRPLARRLDLHRRREAVLARGTAKVGESGSAELRLRIRSAARRALGGRDPSPAFLSAVLTPAGGAASAATVAVPRRPGR